MNPIDTIGFEHEPPLRETAPPAAPYDCDADQSRQRDRDGERNRDRNRARAVAAADAAATPDASTPQHALNLMV